MKKLVKWAGIVFVGFVLLIIGVAIGTGGDTNSDTPTDNEITRQNSATTETATGTVEESAPPEPVREAPEPDGSYELICDYDLGDFGESGDPAAGYKFIGGGTIENTGNVGIEVGVTYKWRLLGQGSLTEQRIYKLKRGRSKDVDITIPATQEQIDAHQSANSKCTTKATILSSFGKPPFE